MRIMAGRRQHLQEATAVTQTNTYKLADEDFMEILERGTTPIATKMVKRRAIRLLFKRMLPLACEWRLPPNPLCLTTVTWPLTITRMSQT